MWPLGSCGVPGSGLDDGAVDADGVVGMMKILSFKSPCMVCRIFLWFTLLMYFGCAGGNQDRLQPQEPIRTGPVVTAKFEIHLTNVPPDAMKVAVAMFRDSETYLTENAAYSRSVPFDSDKSGSATIVLEDVEVGSYAVIVLADVDGDERLTRGAFGVPAECFGFGNNAKGFFGPASFEDALVAIHAPSTETEIRFLRPPFGSDEDASK